MTGHHVVSDRVFRLGARTGPGRKQITGTDSEGNQIKGLSEKEGLVICVRGATPKSTKEHGKIHLAYKKIEDKIGAMSNPPNTASLLELELAGAAAVSKITGCKKAMLATQLRAYHQGKRMGPDFVVRSDSSGRRPVNQNNFSTLGIGKF